jgi:hypothetical protein
MRACDVLIGFEKPSAQLKLWWERERWSGAADLELYRGQPPAAH